MMTFKELVSQTHHINMDGKVSCPVHPDRKPSFHVYDDHGYCFACRARLNAAGWIINVEQCGAIEAANRIVAMGVETGLGATPDTPSPIPTPKALAASRIWHEGQKVKNTPAEKYLRRRGITCDLSGVLRFHPEYRWRTGIRLPVLMARIDDRFGRAQGIQAINIRTGDKESRGELSGNACYLGHPKHHTMLVAEGVVTALSAWLVLSEPACPVATISTSGMRAWKPPRWVKRVVIAADADDPGRSAAQALEHTLFMPTSIHEPSIEGADYNDILMQ